MDFIHAHSFATLISVNTEGVPIATHIPIELQTKSDGQPILRGHLSRANPHAKILQTTTQALALFTGAHTYISSSWYEQENVSTWNYSAVHVYGQVKILTDEELLASLEHLTARYESGVENPLYVSAMTAEKVRKEMRGIIGFEISLDDVQAKAKLSQNRSDQDYKHIVQALEKSPDAQAQEVAQKMKAKRELDYHV
jgi:transcriptional regulator